MKALLIPLLGKLFSGFITRILTAFGFAFVSYSGFNFVLSSLKNYVANTTQNLSTDVFNILMISGLGSGLSYIFGAFAFKLSVVMLTKLVSLPSS